ncbi:carboxymuconolactone decarboxylase family protein [Balneola sp. MJW-20]|uniref:carboxymuconolactone decarboxylase family protein n=1 Tax=Gracilimonas aurantiaca TaxID=3234185 RepID=UPI003465B2CC
MKFRIYNTDNAPEGSKTLLENAEKNFGFIPNLLGEFAEAPAVLEGYLTLSNIVGKTSFTPAEQQLAILAASIENECDYCSAIHSVILKNNLNVDEGIVNAVRYGDSLPDEKLDALVNYTQTVVRKRGHVNQEDLSTFLDAGYSVKQVLEVNLIVTLKTLSNYTNHIAETPLDEAFQSEQISFENV